VDTFALRGFLLRRRCVGVWRCFHRL